MAPEARPSVKLLALAALVALTLGGAAPSVFTVAADLFAELGAALGRAPLGAFVSVVPGEYRAEAILAEVARQVRTVAGRDYGIDVVDVQLRRLDYPEVNRVAVFSRMKSERTQVSMRYRSEGEEEGL